MSYFSTFLSSLFEDGHVLVPEIEPFSEEELSAGREVLCDFEAQYRLALPGGMPSFDLALSEQAAVLFYRACQFAVLRDTPPQQIDEEFSAMQKLPDTPEAHYAVDLVFRFLPDLFRLSKSMMENDPLVIYLKDWANRWPISSVGLKETVSPVQIDGFAKSPGMLRLYCDRILARNDISRLDDPRVRTLVEASWGMYPELAPNIHTHIQHEVKQHDGSDHDH
ncbi:hypothetical protein [Gimesia panareensis]|uniref:hypothetical protein n=1 Tax=Gimesia panareensis TaxID=2527978 RepID=UPI00118CB9AB|nr:hypothetical protein [Gimesia panareensis]QDU49253.1 hypothetical protein Pan110_15720 [Gimesia panareensis]